MGDGAAMWNFSPYNPHFYYQYLQQHARMTQWIQNLHQNLPLPVQNCSKHMNHSCCHHNHHSNHQQPLVQQGHYVPQGNYFPHPGQSVGQQGNYFPHLGQSVGQQGNYIPQQGQYVLQQGNYIPQQGQYVPQQGNYTPQHRQCVPQEENYMPQKAHHVRHQRRAFRHHRVPRKKSHTTTHPRSRSQTSNENVNNEEIVQEHDDEENNSDGELVFNVDAILAFRAEKEKADENQPQEEDAKSEESFELLDAVLNENFEFVELNDAGQLHKIYGKPSVPDAKGDFEYDREARIVLYGERADRIAGLETSLEIMFDHINDLQQPVVYPRV